MPCTNKAQEELFLLIAMIKVD